MPSTNSLNRTINYASIHVGTRPVIGVGNFTNEPAFTIGDWVRQFILAPPFAWRWNRNTTSIPIVANTQDYSKLLVDFGWLEEASINDGSGNIFQLKNRLNLSEESVQNRPIEIAARLDDDTGNITFRLFPIPEKNYTLNISYQKSSPIFLNLTDTWSPIPDYFSYLINQGFLAKVYEFCNDERFLPTMQLFVRQVVAANNGLDETQLNIFLADTIINSQRNLQSVATAEKPRSRF